MLRYIVLVLALLKVMEAEAQFSNRLLETDSSYIEITTNGKKKFWEETYKDRDSVYYKVYHFPDTNTLRQEGWLRDEGLRFGKWAAYNSNGTRLYELDYDKHTCNFNQTLYPRLDTKQQMKKKADTLLINKFGLPFFRQNIYFDFDAHIYQWQLINYPTGRFFERVRIADWVEPAYKKPHGYVLNYSIRLSAQEKFRNYLTIELDSLGVPIKDTTGEALNFDDTRQALSTAMQINRPAALAICKRHPLWESTYDFETTLKYGWLKDGLYPGEFYYEVQQLYDLSDDASKSINGALAKYYNVWRFNPWTGELFFKKRLKKIVKGTSGNGVTGKFLELDE